MAHRKKHHIKKGKKHKTAIHPGHALKAMKKMGRKRG